MNQLSFLDIQKPRTDGAILRDRGIKQAVTHAGEVHDQWQVKALDFLYLFVKSHNNTRFSGEMVRVESKGIVKDPPSLRAWGSIMMAGARRGWIKQVGYIKVRNPLAHRANAALWESLIG